jgi:transcription antitermination protein NusB
MPPPKSGKPSTSPPSARAARTRARGFACKRSTKCWSGATLPDEVDSFTRDLSGFHKADSVHFDALLHGCSAQAEALDAHILPMLDRKLTELSPIEHAVLWIGAYEMQHCIDIPWRVVINECIELAKEFGGTDGHKYVNAVLNQLAPQLRATEVEADRKTPTVDSPTAATE